MTLSPVRIGMLGAGFIGQMHALTFSAVRHSRLSDRVPVDLVVLAEQTTALADEVADRYGWQRTADDWREAATGPDIDLFINAGPNDLHAAPTIAAAAAGKALFSEKPLARDAGEAYGIWKAAADAGVLHMCAFLHRSIPALRLAKQMIEAGELGTIRHFRSNFLMNMIQPDEVLSWRFDRWAAGGGASADLGSHHIDVCRFLAGEVVDVQANAKTWRKDSSGRVTDVNDDWFAAVARLDNDATAVFEATRSDESHSLTGRIEVDGTKGSVSLRRGTAQRAELARAGQGPAHHQGARHPATPMPNSGCPAESRARTRSAGTIASYSRPTRCCPRWPSTVRSIRWPRRSRMAIAWPRSSTRSCARPNPALARMCDTKAIVIGLPSDLPDSECMSSALATGLGDHSCLTPPFPIRPPK